MNRNLIIAIDGPAGSGKSTAARRVAEALQIPYIDTGAMYRAVTLKALTEKVSLTDTDSLIEVARRAQIQLTGEPSKQNVFLDGKNVTAEIRTPELTKNVFYTAREPRIRRELVKKQQEMGRMAGGVLEGRDIGTVVFPEADFKFYLEAKPEVRARRRFDELQVSGQKVEYEKVLSDLIARDKTDYERSEGPLRQADDALALDTSSLTIQEVVDTILARVRSKPMPQSQLTRPSDGRSQC